jgi:hypothetical protein
MSYLRAFLLATVIAVLASVAPSQAADGDLDGWKLSQWVREDGFIDVSICKSAVRIFIPKNGLVVLAAAPWKEANLYCTKTGNIFKTTPAKFHNPYLSAMAMFDGGSIADIDAVLKGPTKSLDIPCRSYIAPPAFSQRQMAKFKNGTIAGRAPLKIEYVVTDHFKTDPHVGQIISRFYALPQTDSVPLQLNYTTVTLDPLKQLNTSSCKKVKIKASDFKLPPGLKAVGDGRSVLVPDNSDGALDLMMMGQSKVK